MRAIFNLDSPAMRLLARISDLIILNLLFLLTCIPLITIGAAWTALSYMTLKIAEGQEGYILKGYFKAMKDNLKKGTLLWLIIVILIGIFVGDYFVITKEALPGPSILHTAILCIGILLFSILQYVFPLNARFENSVSGTLKNAFLFALGYLPRTLAMTAITFGAVFLTLYNGYTLQYGILLWFLTGFSGISLINSCLLRPVFAKYMPQETEDPDHWIMEE